MTGGALPHRQHPARYVFDESDRQAHLVWDTRALNDPAAAGMSDKDL
jgi:hypothetical protein